MKDLWSKIRKDKRLKQTFDMFLRNQDLVAVFDFIRNPKEDDEIYENYFATRPRINLKLPEKYGLRALSFIERMPKEEHIDWINKALLEANQRLADARSGSGEEQVESSELRNLARNVADAKKVLKKQGVVKEQVNLALRQLLAEAAEDRKAFLEKEFYRSEEYDKFQKNQLGI